jgi:hypothetical protein
MEIHVRVPLGHALPALVSYYSLLINICDFSAKKFFSWSSSVVPFYCLILSASATPYVAHFLICVVLPV